MLPLGRLRPAMGSPQPLCFSTALVLLQESYRRGGERETRERRRGDCKSVVSRGRGYSGRALPRLFLLLVVVVVDVVVVVPPLSFVHSTPPLPRFVGAEEFEFSSFDCFEKRKPVNEAVSGQSLTAVKFRKNQDRSFFPSVELCGGCSNSRRDLPELMPDMGS